MNGVHSSDRFIGDVAIERKNKFDGVVESDDTDTVVRANESEEMCDRSLDRRTCPGRIYVHTRYALCRGRQKACKGFSTDMRLSGISGMA
jgi:hypothetical protein